MALAFLLAVNPVLAILMWSGGLVLTYTGSIPRGLYRVATNGRPARRGDILSFCLPGRVAREGVWRGYIHRGICDNGSQPLAKRVIALPGDTVTLTRAKMTVMDSRGRRRDYPAPMRAFDGRHRPIRHFVSPGKRRARGYWMYGYNDPLNSWDSRYYGGIPSDRVTHRLTPILLF